MDKIIPVEVMYGIQTMIVIYDRSGSSINRGIKDGRIPKPDIPGINGSGRKWFKSTVDKHIDSLKAQ